MQNNLPSYLDIYTNTFKINSYSAEHHIQYDFAIDEIKKIYDNESTFTLIDIGSGRGHLINLILKNFKDCKITSVDLEKFNNLDINFIKCDLSSVNDRNTLTNKKYDVLTCTDVFEHLDKSFIEEVIVSCSLLSKECIFAIANHSDIINNIELHTIQENDSWWEKYLLKYFEIKCKKIEYNGKLYMYKCKSLL
jgi:2-polyprenyl-3-methyl-5-hydroxy-6-metoxy-1,4-benzoquinol methylase